MFRDPFTEFENLWDRMQRLYFGRLSERGMSEYGAEQAPWVPEVEVDETEERYTVKAELPGVQHNDVDLQVDEHNLSISGGLQQEQQEGRYLYRRAGRFFYRTALPRDADTDKVSAAMRDGVLTIVLPKLKQASRRVTIAKS